MTNTAEENYQEVTKKATKGMGWNFLSFGGTKLLALVTLFVLAHLLPPENFGLVALATLTMDYLSILSELGFGAALIQKKEKIEESANTAFWINILANAGLTALVFIVAPFVATFFREPELTSVLRWLGLTFILKSFGSIHNALLERELNFKKKMIPDLGGSIIKATVSISLALLGYGAWALVAGQLIGIITSSTLLWYVSSWRPGFQWNAVTARSLFSYGFSIMGSNALSVWEDNFDYLIIGRIFDTTALGIYQIAYRLPETLILNTLWLMTSVLFPAFSKLQDDKDSLKKGFLSTVRYVEMLVVPVCFGMLVTADPLIRVAFGEQWVEAIPLLQVISIYALIRSIGFHAGDVFKAIGRPDLILKISLVIFPIRLIFLWIGTNYGLLGVALGHLIAELISAVINLIVTRRIINVSVSDIFLELKSFLAGFVLLALAVPALYLSKSLLPIASLLLVTFAGGVGYLGSMWFIDRETLIKIGEMAGLGHIISKYKGEKSPN